MARAGKKRFFQALALGIGVAAALSSAPASAGFFDRLFGSIGRAIERPLPAPSSDSFLGLLDRSGGGDDSHVRSANNGPAKAFCVRSCDGHYFPVTAHAGMSAAEACHSFCPTSETRLYIGSDIDYATASDGSRYADMPNAYAYRKKLAGKGCTCNGRTTFGLAHIDATTDPTLRPGDIVATETGLMAFTGKGGDRSNVSANFTPVQNYSGLPKAMRGQLSAAKIARPVAQNDVTSSIPREALNARAEAAR
ncbi:MAG: DUF2865 domain-containing protein [Proteobacteria bacterium]|nr:DUF2865 domain-containing protein [Pseudomonadota bacterium]